HAAAVLELELQGDRLLLIDVERLLNLVQRSRDALRLGIREDRQRLTRGSRFPGCARRPRRLREAGPETQGRKGRGRKDRGGPPLLRAVGALARLVHRGYLSRRGALSCFIVQ